MIVVFSERYTWKRQTSKYKNTDFWLFWKQGVVKTFCCKPLTWTTKIKNNKNKKQRQEAKTRNNKTTKHWKQLELISKRGGMRKGFRMTEAKNKKQEAREGRAIEKEEGEGRANRRERENINHGKGRKEKKRKKKKKKNMKNKKKRNMKKNKMPKKEAFQERGFGSKSKTL